MLQFIINTLTIGSFYALSAIGFRLFFAVVPFFNFSLAALTAASGYLFFFLSSTLAFPFYLAIPMTLLFVVFLSWLGELAIFRPLANRQASPLALMIASIGLYMAVEAFLILSFGTTPLSLKQPENSLQINLFDVDIPLIQCLVIMCSFFVFSLLDLFLNYTFLGRQIRAMKDSHSLFVILGMPSRKIIMICAITSGMIMGLSGILFSLSGSITPAFGFNLFFKGVIGAVIGGMSGIYGAFFGAFILAFAENLGVWILSPEWRDLTGFAIFLIFLHFKPHGIFQKKVKN